MPICKLFHFFHCRNFNGLRWSLIFMPICRFFHCFNLPSTSESSVGCDGATECAISGEPMDCAPSPSTSSSENDSGVAGNNSFLAPHEQLVGFVALFAFVFPSFFFFPLFSLFFSFGFHLPFSLSPFPSPSLRILPFSLYTVFSSFSLIVFPFSYPLLFLRFPNSVLLFPLPFI